MRARASLLVSYRRWLSSCVCASRRCDDRRAFIGESAAKRLRKTIAVAAMLTAEELFVALARDAVAIPVSTAFARVALRSRQERLGFVYVQALLLACLAAVNAQRLATAVYWRDMALTTACEVLSLLAPRHFLGAVVASTATGAAIACGRGGLALRAFVALAVAYAAAPATTDAADVTKMKVSELRAALEAAGADATGRKAELVERLAATQRPQFTRPRRAARGARRLRRRAAGGRYLLPVAELGRAYGAFAAVGGCWLPGADGSGLQFSSDCASSLGVGQLGVDYLRAAQRRKNLLVGAGGQKPLGRETVWAEGHRLS